jgi:hypothetical protein
MLGPSFPLPAFALPVNEPRAQDKAVRRIRSQSSTANGRNDLKHVSQ